MRIQLSLSMAPELYIQDAFTAAEALQNKLSRLFGTGYHVKSVSPSPELAEKKMFSRIFTVAVTKAGTNPTELELLNSPMGIKFIMHLTDNTGKMVEQPTFSFELLRSPTGAKKKGLAYRKVSGKSPTEAASKLFSWFEKNEELLKSF